MTTALTGVEVQRRKAQAWHEFAVMVTNTGPGVPWEAFQCDEIDVVAELLAAHGYDSAAEVVLDEHSDGDDQPGDEHHDRYLLIRGEEEPTEETPSPEPAPESGAPQADVA